MIIQNLYNIYKEKAVFWVQADLEVVQNISNFDISEDQTQMCKVMVS